MTPAGWYPDPSNAAQLRYWDGNAWTEHVNPAHAQPAAGSAAPSRTFTEAARVCLKEKFATFSGRASRSEYWWFQLVVMLIWFGVGAVLGFVAASTDMPALLILVAVVQFALIIPTLAVGVRRMHDLGKSGWWIIVPVANIVFTFMPGEPTANQYG